MSRNNQRLPLSKRPVALFMSAAIILAGWTQVGLAATYTWNGSSNTWGVGVAGWDVGNWANTNEALFTGTLPTSVTVASAGVSVSTANPALSITSGSYSFSGGNIAVGGNGRVTVSPGASASFANPLTGNGNAYYNGTITLSGGISQASTSLFFGNDAVSAITQNGGTVQVTVSSRDITITNTSTYTINSGTLKSTRYLSVLGGSSLVVNGGTVDAPSGVSYGLEMANGSKLVLDGGVVRANFLGNANSLGNVTIELKSGTLQPYSQNLIVAQRNTANVVTLTLTGSNGIISSSDKDGVGRTVTIGGTYVLGIGESGGSRALTFTGNGTNILSGTNTYTGKTTIQAGTFLLLASASLTNSAEIAVQSGAVFDVSAPGGITFHSGKTLSGNGTVLGDVTMGSGAVVVPGSNGVGKLTMTNVTVKAGSKVSMEVTGVVQAGVDFDQVKGVSGSTLTYESGWTLELDFKTFGTVVGNFSVKLFDFPNYSGTGNVPTITLALGSSTPKTYSFNPATGELSFSNPPKGTVIYIL